MNTLHMNLSTLNEWNLRTSVFVRAAITQCSTVGIESLYRPRFFGLDFYIVRHLRFTIGALPSTASAEKNKLPALAESARPGPRVTTEAPLTINF